MNRIKLFKITELFGYQNVTLRFKDEVLILMGENGLGKTSILNSLYFVLTQKWKKLSQISFNTISLEIDDQEIHIDKKQLLWYLETKGDKRHQRNRHLRNELREAIDLEELNNYINNFEHPESEEHRVIYQFLKLNRPKINLNAPLGMMAEIMIQLRREPDMASFSQTLEYLEYCEKINILYFPTYRRVEEELHNLGKLRRDYVDDFPYGNDDIDQESQDLEEETLIQFGMEDVVQRIGNIISKINDSSIKGFAKVTGEMLHQLQEGFPELTDAEILGINSYNVEIILNRVKNNLSEEDRNNILQLLNTKELLKKQELAYFLIKLEAIYVQQQSLDNSIKQFEKVTNQYLVGKRFVFDESSVTLKIYNNTNDDPVELNQLSSGEKQIVSLFSKLYLEDHSNIFIFFDEPELSLSIKWQKQLLPHVLATKKCDFLLAVTHSPFIFNNELENYAVGMNLFID